MPTDKIRIRGARENNLAGVDVSLPRDALTVITGVSGSGKSSLAFDTLYSEGHRRFVESLSSYARQFLGQMEKPRVDHVEGLSPTVSIDQKTVNRNPRSTVGTVTELYDCLRLLFARLGVPHCPECGHRIEGQTPAEIGQRILALGADAEHPPEKPPHALVLAPLVDDRKGEYRKELQDLATEGFVRARIDGEIRRLEDEITLDRYKRHTIEIIIDRVPLAPDRRTRLVESVGLALDRGGGQVRVLLGDRLTTFSALRSCPRHDVELPEIEPRLFSFNSPHGACPDCKGLGWKRRVDSKLVVPDGSKSIAGGAFANLDRTGKLLYTQYRLSDLQVVADHLDISLDSPWRKLPAKVRQIMLKGTGKIELEFDVAWEGRGRKVTGKISRAFRGIVGGMEHFLRWAGGGEWSKVSRFLAEGSCNSCDGTRLRPEARAIQFRGRSISDVSLLTVADADRWFGDLELAAGRERSIGTEIVKEIRTRLRFLIDVGLSYITLDRATGSLSGGEAQRIRLARQVGSGLQGVLYVLDEPSIGLHARDNRKLLDTLGALRDLGNTIVVVEHDEETMRSSDHIIDVGPGAGVHGGRIVASGDYSTIRQAKHSQTADYLLGRRSIQVPDSRRPPAHGTIAVRGARQFNLKNIDVELPLGCLIAVTGVSGSGKSTLVDQILYRALRRHLHGAHEEPGEHDRIDNIDAIDKVIEIDQSPIGRTPRSNPATYTKVFTEIRTLFARVPESRARGYQAGRFSFNVTGGRCEYCKGAGVRDVEMQFLASVQVPCEECDGLRFNRETLEIRYKGRTINDVLGMTVDEANAFYADVPKIARTLRTLADVGLGYIELGQRSTTLSGGEAQRVKLASELRRPDTGKTLYILDEPTTGLHFADVDRLIAALQRLVSAGNTVLVIEHNSDVIKVADWIVDLGPEGGQGGGNIVASGTPEAVAESRSGPTATLLLSVLGDSPKARPRRRRSRARSATDGVINVKGARTHNLKGIDVAIPHGKMTVVTGLSGSGKSSLAFETVFAEGQRRFVESLSTYARRFLGRMDKPPVESIEGLAPAIAIDQGRASRSPRSTVATSTELHDYLRLLWARIGRPHCPDCGREMKAYFPTGAAEEVLMAAQGRRLYITVPLFDEGRPARFELGNASELVDASERLIAEGFLRVLVEGEDLRLDEEIAVDLRDVKRVDAVVDRVRALDRNRRRIAEAFDRAYRMTGGIATVVAFSDSERRELRIELSTRPGCVACDRYLESELTPRMFSFNSHQGACPECAGLGISREPDVGKLIADPRKPILAALDKAPAFVLRHSNSAYGPLLRAVVEQLGATMRTPWRKLSEDQKAVLLNGDEGRIHKIRRKRRQRRASRDYTSEMKWEGLGPLVKRWHAASTGGPWTKSLERVMEERVCSECDGQRLKREMLAVTIADRNIMDVGAMTVAQCGEWFNHLEGGLSAIEAEIARDAIGECISRLGFLEDVGVGYLGLDRASSTLSGGEAQRIRLASQIGNKLTGVIYVLDEPTVGLHPRDTERLLDTLEDLRDLGNTVLVVEHDRDTIERADHVIDLGPGAGEAGGHVVSTGSPRELALDSESLTGAYLSGREKLAPPETRRSGRGGRIDVRGCRTHNLRSVDADIHLGAFTVVSGVSGSGKSSLVMETIRPAIAELLNGGGGDGVVSITQPADGAKPVEKLAVIDQAPIGRTPKSNPATYGGAIAPIRELFAKTRLARQRGYSARRFSFNIAEGRCPICEGAGATLVEMHFLSDVWVRCDTCKGRRYNDETLEVRYRGKTIADVLEMHIEEATVFFQNHRRIHRVLDTLSRVGLGYMRLGQSATTLSGGEAQRVKLAAELARVQTGDTLYLLDEPTTGLHLADVKKLLEVIQSLVDNGNTVITIEHHPDVMLAADFLVDMGPEAGDEGGLIVASGTPEDVMETDTHTALALREHQRKGKKRVAGKRTMARRHQRSRRRTKAGAPAEAV